MFGFVKKVFFTAMTFFNFNPSNVNSLERISINNEPVFYPFSIQLYKCSESCNNINDPYAKLCVADVVKNIHIEVFNLMSWINQKSRIEWHETCKCKRRSDASVCNNKQTWNEDDKGILVVAIVNVINHVT